MSAVGRRCRGAALLGFSLVVTACGAPPVDRPLVEPAQGFEAVVIALEHAVEQEVRDKGVPAVSIALVSGQRTVWAKGFGIADPDEKIPATAETVYRAGAVSSLFTGIGVMRLQEEGTIDLDTPIREYLPELDPRNPFGRALTLRMLMSHRAGLGKELPSGHIFDATAPSLADSIASLNTTRLVYEPGTTTKYSNAGVAVAGRIIERLEGQPFAAWMKAHVLDPMGLDRSAFEPTPVLTPRMAQASMWTYDGRAFAAPTFELGSRPAVGMYTTVLDLAQFLTVLNARGRLESGSRLLRSATLDRMWDVQYPEVRSDEGYGLGFRVSRLGTSRRVGHSGALYGFTTEVALLPESDFGVVVMASMDGATAVVRELADYGLLLLTAARDGRTLPPYAVPTAVPAESASRLAGRFSEARQPPANEAEAFVRAAEAPAPPSEIEFLRRGDRLMLDSGTWRDEVKLVGSQLTVSGRLAVGPTIMFSGPASLTMWGVPYRPTKPTPPADILPSWRGLIGEYGWDHSTFYVLEREGRLWMLAEWFYGYPLDPGLPDEFWFPHYGLYAGEHVMFTRDSEGRATQMSIGGVTFDRRFLPGEITPFRITPQRPMDQVRAEAMAAAPPTEPGLPREPDLVDVVELEPTIKLDVRYATANNFLGTRLYAEPRALLQRPAAEALARAHHALEPLGYGLLVHDGYRPWHITKVFWEATPPQHRRFVADPARGSRHNRACAVDLTLYDRATGRAVDMTAGYDEFSDRAYPDYPGGTSLQRWRRERLRQVMEDQGFEVAQNEWWHFDYRGWQQYPILNITLASFESHRALQGQLEK